MGYSIWGSYLNIPKAGEISTPYNKKDPSMRPLCLRLTQERSHCIAAAWLRRVRPHVGTLGDT